MSSSKSCSKCHKNVTASRFPGISCVDCNNPYHWNCAEISEAAKNSIVKNKLSWTCKICKRRSKIFADAPSSGSYLSPAVASQPSSSRNIADLQSEINSLKELLDAAIKRIDSLEVQLNNSSQQIVCVATDIQRLESSTSAVERHLVNDNLEVQNLPESSLEHPLQTALDLGVAIGCPINESDLKTVPIVDRKRLRLVFHSKATRRTFLLAGKQFNREQGRFLQRKVHVNEVLTSHQRQLFEKSHAFKVANNFKFLWFGSSGQLLLKKEEHSQIHVIHSIESLKDAAILSECQRAPDQIAGVSPSHTTQ